MKKPSYKRELSHSYLVVDEIPGEYQNSYQYKMILRNRIPGLLASSERHLEGRVSLYYDISSRQSLSQLYLSEQISFQALKGMVDNLVQVQDSLAEYLLEEKGLVLEPDYIYMDLESEQLFFLYDPLPSRQKQETGSYQSLTEFFLEHVDHREREAMSAAYQFYRMAKVRSFTIGSFRAWLERGMQEERGAQEESFSRKKWETEPREGSPGQDGVYGRGMRSRPADILLADQEGSYEYRRDGGNRPVRGLDEDPFSHRGEETGRLGKSRQEAWEPSAWRGRAEQDMDCEEEKWEEDGIREEGEEETEEGRREREGKWPKKGCLAGLVLSAVFFLGLCALIWYLAPSGQQKLLLFAALAADGLSFLIFLWLVTGERGTAGEAGREEKETEEESAFWEEYGEEEEGELGGPTVYLGSIGGMEDGPGIQDRKKHPRLTGQVGGREREYSLEGLPVLAGKMRGRVQILLPEASVSRIHARFIELNGRVALMDMNSTNGTYVNDIRLEPEETVVLEAGDEIRLGDVRMQYTV